MLYTWKTWCKSFQNSLFSPKHEELWCTEKSTWLLYTDTFMLCKGWCMSCRSHPAQNTIHFQIIFPSTWLKKKFSTSLFWISDDGEIKKRICEAVMNTRFLIPNGMVITSDTIPTSTPHLFYSTHPLTHILKSKTASCVSSCVHLF